MSTFKYNTEILSFNPNLDDFKENHIECYRYTTDKPSDKTNFLPLYIINKARLKQQLKKGQAQFIGYGLSLYKDKEEAIKKYNSMIDNKPQLHKLLGTHLSVGKILVTCGKSGKANPISHFTLLEYQDATLESNFKIDEQLFK